MGFIKKDEVIGIKDNGYYHLDCYDGNFDDLEKHNILTEKDFDEEDFLFCKKCGKKI